MTNNDKSKLPRRGPIAIGAAAERRREEIKKMDEAEALRKDEYRKRKELLERKLKQDESAAKRATKVAHLKEEQRVCYLLGAIVLNAMKQKGMTDLHLSRADLNVLKADDQRLVSVVAERHKNAAESPLNDAAGLPYVHVDLDDVPY